MKPLVLLAFSAQFVLLQARPSLPVGQRVYENDCSRQAYEQYLKDFGKTSDSLDGERNNRFCDVIKANEANNNANTGFKRGVNFLSDLSEDEYRRRLGFAYPNKKTIGKETENVEDPENGVSAKQSLAIPESIDWREKGFTSTVKDQGNCSSSWAFATTGAIEFAKYKKDGTSIKLSEQNLIDCSMNSGCSGGNPGLAMKYIVENGVDAEDTYPYIAKDGLCNYIEGNREQKITDFAWLQSGNENSLKEAVTNIGPIAVGIDASLDSFRNYQSGIYYDRKCSRNVVNHAVLVVGYGSDANFGEFWIIKNSWGVNWGEEGYARIARNRNNHCGIASSPVYPIV